MSLATRCTRCGTIFRVVQDQLKVSEGWVRCGRCQEVFNALEGLFDLERDAPPQRTAAASAQRSPPQRPSATETVARAMEEFIASQHPPLRDDSQLPATHEDDAIESRFLARPSERAALDEDIAEQTRDADEEDDNDDPLHPAFVDARFPSDLSLDAFENAPLAPEQREVDEDEDKEPSLDALDPTPAQEATSSLRQRWRQRRAQREQEAISSLFETSAQPSMTGDILPEEEESLRELLPAATPEFVRQAEHAARWHRPRVRASLVIAALLLAGLLAAQVAVQFRDSLAAAWPQARSTLESLCELRGCRIGPPRRLAALTVESSGLAQIVGSDAYRLSVALNNRAAVALAAPAIELALTDGSGNLIARRTLLAGDFRSGADGKPVAPEAALPPGSETQWQALLAIDGVPVSGYTVELFYP